MKRILLCMGMAGLSMGVPAARMRIYSWACNFVGCRLCVRCSVDGE